MVHGASGAIGRITPEGVVTEFTGGIAPASGLRGITAGPDGNLWFTDFHGQERRTDHSPRRRDGVFYR